MEQLSSPSPSPEPEKVVNQEKVLVGKESQYDPHYLSKEAMMFSKFRNKPQLHNFRRHRTPITNIKFRNKYLLVFRKSPKSWT